MEQAVNSARVSLKFKASDALEEYLLKTFLRLMVHRRAGAGARCRLQLAAHRAAAQPPALAMHTPPRPALLGRGARSPTSLAACPPHPPPTLQG